MKIEYLKDLHEHMIKKFNSLNKISELKEFPTTCIENKTEKTIFLHDHLYKIHCVSISVNIKKIFSKNYTEDERVLIISEFHYCISKIMEFYDVKNINFTNESITGSFQVNQRADFNDLFECCAVINTFKQHINKVIKNYLIKAYYNENYHYLDFGIGMWFSFDNYIYETQNINNREINMIGESIFYSNELSIKSIRNIEYNILLNQLTLENMTDEYLKAVMEVIQETNFDLIKNQKIYVANVIYTKYLNWIENNIN